MRNSHSRYLASAALVLAVPASPAFAHVHHHGIYRHHRAHLALATQQNCIRLFGMQFPCPFGASRQSPQAPQQNFSGFAPFGGAANPGSAYDGLVAAQASANGVPASLINRVIRRESGGNARAVSAGNYGLMQIKLATARAMGYGGSAAGLLDPATNMTYAARYLAGAYRAAGGNESRAVALYARGYYGAAKAQGFSPYASGTTGSYYGTASPAPNTLFAWAAPSAASPTVYRVKHSRHHAA